MNAPLDLAQRTPLQLSPMNLEEAFGETPPPMEFVWPAFARQTVGVLPAAGSTGKTFLALQAALCLASGDPELQARISPGIGFPSRPAGSRVLYFGGEDPPAIIRHRLHAIGQATAPLSPGEDPADPRTIQRRNDRARYVTRDACQRLQVVSTLGQQIDVADKQSVAELIAFANDGDTPLLLIFDTLSRFHSADENDNGAMARVLGSFEHIIVKTGASVLLLHHVSKQAALNGTAVEQQAARGASSIIDNARYAAGLQVMTPPEAEKFADPTSPGNCDGLHSVEQTEKRKQYVKFEPSKTNYGRAGAAVWLRRGLGGVLQPVTLQTISTTKKKAHHRDVEDA